MMKRIAEESEDDWWPFRKGRQISPPSSRCDCNGHSPIIATVTPLLAREKPLGDAKQGTFDSVTCFGYGVHAAVFL